MAPMSEPTIAEDPPTTGTWIASWTATVLMLGLSIGFPVLIASAQRFYVRMEIKELPVPTEETLALGNYAGLPFLGACAWGLSIVRRRSRAEVLEWFLSCLSLLVLAQGIMLASLYAPIYIIMYTLSR
jgi:hypothetical protein